MRPGALARRRFDRRHGRLGRRPRGARPIARPRAKKKEEPSAGAPRRHAQPRPKDGYGIGDGALQLRSFCRSGKGFLRRRGERREERRRRRLFIPPRAPNTLTDAAAPLAKYESVGRALRRDQRRRRGAIGTRPTATSSPATLDRAYALYHQLRTWRVTATEPKAGSADLRILQQQNAAKASRAAAGPTCRAGRAPTASHGGAAEARTSPRNRAAPQMPAGCREQARRGSR